MVDGEIADAAIKQALLDIVLSSNQTGNSLMK